MGWRNLGNLGTPPGFEISPISAQKGYSFGRL